MPAMRGLDVSLSVSVPGVFFSSVGVTLVYVLF